MKIAKTTSALTHMLNILSTAGDAALCWLGGMALWAACLAWLAVCAALVAIGALLIRALEVLP